MQLTDALDISLLALHRHWKNKYISDFSLNVNGVPCVCIVFIIWCWVWRYVWRFWAIPLTLLILCYLCIGLFLWIIWKVIHAIIVRWLIFQMLSITTPCSFPCSVLCVMRPYTEGLLDRYRIGIPRELSKIRTQPWLSEGSLTCDPCQHRGPIFNCAPCSCFHIMKDMLGCYLWASNHQPFDYWRAHHVYYVAS